MLLGTQVNVRFVFAIQVGLKTQIMTAQNVTMDSWKLPYQNNVIPSVILLVQTLANVKQVMDTLLGRSIVELDQQQDKQDIFCALSAVTLQEIQVKNATGDQQDVLETAPAMILMLQVLGFQEHQLI